MYRPQCHRSASCRDVDEDLGIDSGTLDVRHVLGAVDREPSPDAPLLSALMTGNTGGPVPFFRDVLRTAGLAVPQTDEALLKIWCREQERAYAAYGTPPRPLSLRLVPTVSQAELPRT